MWESEVFKLYCTITDISFERIMLLPNLQFTRNQFYLSVNFFFFKTPSKKKKSPKKASSDKKQSKSAEEVSSASDSESDDQADSEEKKKVSFPFAIFR